jgi:hypothetical protein
MYQEEFTGHISNTLKETLARKVEILLHINDGRHTSDAVGPRFGVKEGGTDWLWQVMVD